MSTLNGHQVISARIRERTVGAWGADLEVDSDGEPLSGAVTLDVQGETWAGTVYRGDAWGSRYPVRVVGGAGGMATAVPAAYLDHGVELRSLIQNVLALGGETLSDESDEAILSLQVPAYHRAASTVAGALNAILELKAPAGTVWRMLRDGTVWVGVDTFPDLEVQSTDVDTDADPTDNLVEIAPETPYVCPGVTYDGRRVSEVTTWVMADRRLRQELLCMPEGRPRDTVEVQIRNGTERRAMYRRMYTATVLSQSGNLVDVLPDDERIRGDGLTRVPIRLGIPGAKITFPPGAQVLIGWQNGDPSYPFATMWLAGAALTSMTITGNLTVVGALRVEGAASAQSVSSDTEVTWNALSVPTRASTHSHASAGTAGSVAPGTPPSPPTPGT